MPQTDCVSVRQVYQVLESSSCSAAKCEGTWESGGVGLREKTQQDERKGQQWGRLGTGEHEPEGREPKRVEQGEHGPKGREEAVSQDNAADRRGVQPLGSKTTLCHPHLTYTQGQGRTGC